MTTPPAGGVDVLTSRLIRGQQTADVASQLRQGRSDGRAGSAMVRHSSETVSPGLAPGEGFLGSCTRQGLEEFDLSMVEAGCSTVEGVAPSDGSSPGRAEQDLGCESL